MKSWSNALPLFLLPCLVVPFYELYQPQRARFFFAAVGEFSVISVVRQELI
jgi:hypothetical protein